MVAKNRVSFDRHTGLGAKIDNNIQQIIQSLWMKKPNERFATKNILTFKIQVIKIVRFYKMAPDACFDKFVKFQLDVLFIHLKER